MTKKSTLPQSRRHILVFDEDWEFLEQEFGKQSAHPIGVSEVIRMIVHARVTGLKMKANTEYDRIRDEMPVQAQTEQET
jgi:hypothetical protein